MPNSWRLPTFEAGIRMGTVGSCQVSYDIIFSRSVAFSPLQYIWHITGGHDKGG